MNLDAVASCLMQSSKFKQTNRQFTRNVNLQLKMEWNSPSADQNLCKEFSTNEVMTAINTLKAGKAPSSDNLYPEFFLHLDEKCFEWLQILFSNCLSTKKLPKVSKMAKALAALKMNKPTDNPGSYRPISLPRILYKPYERLIYNRIKLVIESVLPEEKAGF